jgi:hypothetical protein
MKQVSSCASYVTVYRDGKNRWFRNTCRLDARPVQFHLASPWPFLYDPQLIQPMLFPPQTAEIVVLLYEATQGPRHPNETPLLNPTGGVTRKQPIEGLDYRKDPTRPGGGVFVARGHTRDENYRDLPEGTVITRSSDEETEGEALVHRTSIATDQARVHYHHNGRDAANAAGSSSLVNFTPLGGGDRAGSGNLNPALNAQSSSRSQVINILDMPHSSNIIVESAIPDTGLLEGIPGGIADWGESFLNIVPCMPAY